MAKITKKSKLLIGVPTLMAVTGVVGLIAVSCNKKHCPNIAQATINNFDGTDWFDYQDGDRINISLEQDKHNSIDGYFSITHNSYWKQALSIPYYIHDESGKGIYEFLSVGYDAFKNDTELTSVECGCARTIQDYAFSGCTNLTSIHLGTVSSISRESFSGDTGLTSVDFRYVSSYGIYAFDGCTSLESVTFRHMESIESFVFRNCDSLNLINFTTLNYTDWQVVDYGSQIFQNVSATGTIKANGTSNAAGWLNLLKTNTDRFSNSFSTWDSAANPGTN